MAQKYFQIGFNKCGTSSLAHFFAANGLPCVHWDDGRLARRMKQNLEAGRFILAGYEAYDAFTDMECMGEAEYIEAYKYFREIAEQVEGAMFILNVRPKETWIASRLDHLSHLGPRSFAELYRSVHGLPDREAVVEAWSRDWDRHLEAVQDSIPAERLLVFDIERDSPRRLCAFAGLEPSAADHYTVQNHSLTDFGRLISRMTPAPIKRALPRAIKDPIRRRLRKHRPAPNA
ncbi:MAG: sulfotransferase [Kiloniellales bacterium]|nr:sulfotransferase [Kiloniellales bacterium]